MVSFMPSNKVISGTPSPHHVVGGNVNTIKKNSRAQLDTSKEAGLEGSADRTKYSSCLIARMQDKIVYKDC